MECEEGFGLYVEHQVNSDLTYEVRLHVPKLSVTAGLGRRGQPEPLEVRLRGRSASLVHQRIQAMTTMRPMMARTVQTMPMVRSLLLLLVVLGHLLEMRHRCSAGLRRPRR